MNVDFAHVESKIMSIICRYLNISHEFFTSKCECVIIMAEEHAREAHYLSLKEKGKRHARTKGLYINRTLGGDRNYCAIDGNTDAGATAGKETSKGSCL
jgi:hypothetical protein